jgi:hypothetical protein
MKMKLPKQAPGVERNIHKRGVALASAGGAVRPSFLPLLFALL